MTVNLFENPSNFKSTNYLSNLYTLQVVTHSSDRALSFLFRLSRAKVVSIND